MRRITWASTLVVIGLASTGIGAGSGGSQDRSQDARHDRGCNEATLKGVYGFQFQGTRPVRPPFPAGIESFYGIGIRTYDGEGGFTQRTNVKGSVIGLEVDVESTGTYQVNEDCTAIASSEFVPGIAVTAQLVIVDNGREVLQNTMTPLSIFNAGVMTKVHGR